jgi:hypothetical protein
MAEKIKNVTELDFDQIKINLKAFLSSQEKFNDYDFDGSGLNVLLDVLAYNTQYNALLAHMTANEAFLDTAQIRSNVVSRAKDLGYMPKSNKAATAQLKVTVTGDAESAATIQIAKGTAFLGVLGSLTKTFVTNNTFEASKNSSNQYVFNNVEVFEGALNTLTFRVDNRIERQKFKIDDAKIDTSTMLVRVRESLTSTEAETYRTYTNLVDIKSDTRAYFIKENFDGIYEIHFGDNNIGKRPATGEIVEITYITTNGADGNGCKSFSINSSIAGLSQIAIERAAGFDKTINGTDRETIESIKFNAPQLFAAQNRAVTSEDYKSILKANYDFIQDISVWGGEVNDPPLYGKVFISIKPNDSEFLTTATKTSIEQFLSNKNVGSVTVELEDPDYTYVTGTIEFKYDPNNTNRTRAQLQAAVKDAIALYNTNKLGKFDGVLRYSDFLRTIDNVDEAILNSFARLQMHKRIVPITGVASNYTINFASPLYITDTAEETLSSSTFTVGTTEVVIGDTLVGDGTNNRTVQLKNASTGDIVNANIGILYPATGVLELQNLNVASTANILIYADPASYDIAPRYNQLIDIEFSDSPGITVTGEEDTIAMLGTSGSVNYNTFNRDG